MLTPIPRPVTVSTRLYRLLLWAYPSPFRNEYGPLMLQVFRDSCRTMYQQGGTGAIIWLWLPMLFDVLINSIKEHVREVLTMSSSRWTGNALMLGGVLYFIGLFGMIFEPGPPWDDPIGGPDALYEYATLMIFPGLLLLALGLLGVFRYFGERAGRLGKTGLIAAVLGAIIAMVGFLGLSLADMLWAVAMLGMALHSLGLILFGVVCLRGPLLTRGNILPLIVGLVFPTLVAVSNIVPDWNSTESQIAGIILLTSELLWVVWGHVFKAEVQERAV